MSETLSKLKKAQLYEWALAHLEKEQRIERENDELVTLLAQSRQQTGLLYDAIAQIALMSNVSPSCKNPRPILGDIRHVADKFLALVQVEPETTDNDDTTDH